MNKLALPFALAASLMLGSVALAAATTTEGVIKALDAKADTITLADGTVYHLAKTIKIATFKVGEKVKVVWEKSGTANEASAVTVE